MLNRGQSAEIERMQKRVARLCFGFNKRYHVICLENDIETLEARRLKAIEKFTRKAMSSERFSRKWFVPRPEIENNLRVRRPFIENKARTSRYRNSPLVNIQRTANNLITGH